MSKQNKIAVLGAGAFGTALACVASRKGHQVSIWARDESVCEEINSNQANSKYLPDIKLNKMNATTNLSDVVKDAHAILVAIPAQKISTIAIELKTLIKPDTSIVLCAKGIDQQTGKLPSQTMAEHLPDANISALSGPSFAADIASGLPTAITIASSQISNAQALANLLSDPAFRLYASNDIIGAELGGALKNVIALAVGVCRTMQLGASAEAALIARGFAELTRLATKLGAQPKTLSGLSGLGDLVLTCSSPQSRNFSYGMALGKSSDLSKLPLAEGAFTASIAQKIATKNNIDCPIIETVAKLVASEINSDQAVKLLLARPLKQESE